LEATSSAFTLWQTVLCDLQCSDIADYDVRFCRLTDQLADVNIQSSVGMFTISRLSDTYSEPFGFLVLLHNFR